MINPNKEILKMKKKRNISEAGRESFRRNLERARQSGKRLLALSAGLLASDKAQKASKVNAVKAHSTRTARAILKAIPAGATAGTKFVACQRRKLEVIDPIPVKAGDQWEQKFRQSVTVYAFRERIAKSGIVRVVWNEPPTLDRILVAPQLETVAVWNTPPADIVQNPDREE